MVMIGSLANQATMECSAVLELTIVKILMHDNPAPYLINNRIDFTTLFHAEFVSTSLTTPGVTTPGIRIPDVTTPSAGDWSAGIQESGIERALPRCCLLLALTRTGSSMSTRPPIQVLLSQHLVYMCSIPAGGYQSLYLRCCDCHCEAAASFILDLLSFSVLWCRRLP